METYIGNIVDWKHKNRLETKFLDWKHDNEIGNKKSTLETMNLNIGNKIRRLETVNREWKHKSLIGNILDCL